jgi:tetratricopeptide (TPR) repeat protein
MQIRVLLMNAAPILVSAFAVTAWAQSSQSVVAAIREKKYSEAAALATQALKAAPNDVQLLTLQGVALKELGRSKDALAAFTSALHLSPDYLAALEGAAEIDYEAGDDRAIPLLDRLLKLRPDETTAHAMRAVMAWKHHDCKTAVQHFEQARTVIESQPDALREFGVCLVRLEKPEAAGVVFEEMLKRNPEDRSARFSLASIHMMTEHYQEAIDCLQSLISGEHPEPEALDLLSSAYEAIGDTPRAVSMLRQAIVLAPRNIDYYVDFATISFAHKSYDVGIQMVSAGLQLSPDSPKLHLARGILYIQVGQFDKADADFAISERLDPDLPGTAAARVLKLLQRNDMEGAIRAVNEEMKSRPTDGFLYYLEAEVLNWQGPKPGTPEFQRTLDAALTAVRLEPNLTLARNLLSRLYLDSGRVDLAIEQCRLVLRDSPEDTVAIYRLIRALKNTGKPEDAEEIPGLLKRFNQARQVANQREARENRFKIIEAAPQRQ